MPAYILNTCGTSLLTNNANDDMRKLINKYTNTSNWEDLSPDLAEKLRCHIQQRQEKLLSADTDTVAQMSAELNGLLAWQKQHQNHPQDFYVLLATDTIFGKETAKIIELWLKKKGHQTMIMTQSGLKTSKLTDFREASSGLIKQLIDTLNGYQEKNYEIYFNLTGGFKSLNGLLQAVSTIYADKTFYLFEGSKELLFIPKLPFEFNPENIVGEHLQAFRRLSKNLSIDEQEKNAIPDSLLFTLDDVVILSEWGELLWQNCYKKFYQNKLLPSISERIIFEYGFENSAKGLSPNLLQIVNERIAEMANYAENDCKHMLQSLDAKPLQGEKYKKQNRWECDLDGNHRIFMIKDGYQFKLQEIGEALH